MKHLTDNIMCQITGRTFYERMPLIEISVKTRKLPIAETIPIKHEIRIKAEFYQTFLAHKVEEKHKIDQFLTAIHNYLYHDIVVRLPAIYNAAEYGDMKEVDRLIDEIEDICNP